MKDINFIYKKKVKDNQLKVKRLIIFMLIFSIAIISSFYCLTIKVKQIKGECVSIKGNLNKFDEVILIKKSIDGYNQKVNYMTKVLDSVSETSIINTKILREVSSVMPSAVYLSNYAVSDRGEINLMGQSKDNDSIAYYVHELKNISMFSEVSLRSVTKIEDNNYDEKKSISQYHFNVFVKIKK